MVTKRERPTGGRPPRTLPSLRGLTRSQVLRGLGVSSSTLDGWRRQGLPDAGGRYDVAEIVRWLRTRIRVQEREGREPSRALEEWRRLRASREKLAFDRETGELIDRDVVVAYAGRAVLTVRNRLNDIVRKMAARLFNAPSREWIEEQLQEEVDAICATYERGMRTDSAATEPLGASAGSEPADAETEPPADAGTDRRNEQ